MSFIRILEGIQTIFLMIAMCILLSDYYKTFDFFPDELKGIISFLCGFFLITHALFLLYASFKGKFEVRILIEALVVFACALILISPAFNTFFYIEYLSLFESIHKDVLSHLALGLLPIFLVSVFDVFHSE